MLEILGKLIAPVSRLLVAILFFLIALASAEIVKSIVVKLLRKWKVDEKLKKFGVEDEKSGNSIELLGKMAYLIVLLLILPSVFDMLGMTSVSGPVTSMLMNVFGFVPKILAAIIILAVGIAIAQIASGALKVLLVSIGTDKFLEKSGYCQKISLSGWIAGIVKYVIYIVAFAEAANALQMSVLSHIGEMMINYIPYGIAAALILAAAFFLGNLAEQKIREQWPEWKKGPEAVKAGIFVVGIFMALSQLQIAPELINGLFMLCAAAVAAAFALAFGLGGQQFAAHTLEKLERKLSEKTEKTEENPAEAREKED